MPLLASPITRLAHGAGARMGLSVLALAAAGAMSPALAVYIGQPVTPGTVQDNNPIKIALQSYSSSSGTIPTGYTYAVAYIAPDANWASTGAIDVSFQLFNPGNPPISSGQPKLKIGDGIQMLINPTTTGTKPTSSTTSLLGTFTIGTGVNQITKTSTVNVDPTLSGNYNSTAPYSGTGGGPSGFTYQAYNAAQLNAPAAPSAANAGGDIINWVITPNQGKFYVSDFYSSFTSSGNISLGIHYIGINSSSSYLGSTPADITYAVPEPGTWAAMVGIAGVVGVELGRRRRSPRR
jgi:hypothetical protein